MNPLINIVVPVYNSERWIKDCLKSIFLQSYKNWKCIVINDASTDKTKNIIDKTDFINNDNRFKVIHNKYNKKALFNIVNGFDLLECKNNPNSILTVIDGDDFLYSESSLEKVASYYKKDKDLLLTYGNWIGHPCKSRSNCFKYSNDIIKNNLFRFSPFVASHLRTFKSKLWYSIDLNDLKDEQNIFFTVAWDVAFMIPMLEMSQEKHIFIEDILYVYNKENPISDYKVRLKEQENTARFIKEKKVYERKEFL